MFSYSVAARVSQCRLPGGLNLGSESRSVTESPTQAPAAASPGKTTPGREDLPRRERPAAPPRWRPLTPALPLPAGVAMALPPPRPTLSPPAGVCLHRAGGAGALVPGETGTQPTATAARPPSPPGGCSGRRGMKVMLAAVTGARRGVPAGGGWLGRGGSRWLAAGAKGRGRAGVTGPGPRR